VPKWRGIDRDPRWLQWLAAPDTYSGRRGSNSSTRWWPGKDGSCSLPDAGQPHLSCLAPLRQFLRIEQFINYFNATMAKPFRWTYAGKPLAE
jgi:hypothetical protein